MASRQGGPGGDDVSGARSTGSPDTPGLDTPAFSGQDGGAANAGTAGLGALPTEPSDSESGYEDGPPAAARRTPEDPPLRDPGLYALTDHFRERLGQPGRYVSIRTVSDAIRHGQLRWNRTDGWRFALVKDGIRFIVVVSDTETGSPVVVTGWTEIADRETATASTRWDTTDVDTIAVRTALSESSSTQIPDRIRPHGIQRPFEVGDHRLRTQPGDSFLHCTECNRRFRSKEELTTRHCRSRSGQ